MDFENAVGLIGTVTDLRRAASSHSFDHTQNPRPWGDAFCESMTENPS